MKINQRKRTVELTVDEINSLPVDCPRNTLPAGYQFLSNRLNGTMGRMFANGRCMFYQVIEVK